MTLWGRDDPIGLGVKPMGLGTILWGWEAILWSRDEPVG